jgi:hypothetical protein
MPNQGALLPASRPEENAVESVLPRFADQAPKRCRIFIANVLGDLFDAKPAVFNQHARAIQSDALNQRERPSAGCR